VGLTDGLVFQTGKEICYPAGNRAPDSAFVHAVAPGTIATELRNTKLE